MVEQSPINDILAGIENYRRKKRNAPPRACLVCERPVRTKGLCAKHYAVHRKHGSPLARKLLPSGEKKAYLDRVIEAYSPGSQECIIWPFKAMTTGYGAFQTDGKEWTAHRYVCLMVNGDPPEDGMEAAHSCGNGNIGCISPGHLRWATKLENAHDRVMHHGGTIISDEMVRIIRERAKSKAESQKKIADEYKISQSTVSRIVSGELRSSVGV